ncbi:SMP-30/gluconolactonase/LRE family protein [Terrimonas pollutisoli]|uniref:SMP-30/gluconolactonase/LRE family protein n=1 Tax=Terrimonas pollutisoli TaxID=3034147 RepID=UPI0023EBFBEC|nr:SMP-30/gluconolactonase/LRE family protein [Terrimonas sp. H1YJ31]
MKPALLIFTSFILFACNNNPQNKKQESTLKTMGTIERIDVSLDNIISAGAQPEIIADGFEWSEGPLWIEQHNMLLFSDVPTNTVYKWTEEKGKEIYLNPSGYTDSAKRGGEMGSNGLTLDTKGNLVLCQHGNRQMAMMDAPLDQPAAKFVTLAGKYQGKRFSSPNDAVYNSAGELFFTDPPYGLESQSDDDPKKEISWNGVYKLKTNGEVLLLVDSITRPNGLAFLPGEKQLIIACSDSDRPNWYIYDISGDSLINGKIFYSTANERQGVKGLPDGLKIDKAGNIFATGPGGVWIFNSNGKVAGKIRLEESASNVALSTDEKTLYITNDMYVLRLKMKAP